MQFYYFFLFGHSFVKNLLDFIINTLTYYLVAGCHLYINLAFLYFISLNIQHILTRYLRFFFLVSYIFCSSHLHMQSIMAYNVLSA